MLKPRGGEKQMGALDGKVAIVTGATSGIGERIAEVFVAEGARVVAAGRREAEGAALEARGGQALSFIRSDVSVEADVKAMVDHAVTRFGRVDCIVNNAGSGSPRVSIADVDIANFDQVMSTNLRGVVLGMKYAARVMLEQRSGSIINIASLSGHVAGIVSHTYSTSKAAVIHLTRCVAAELGESGIRVNSISPGAIVTGIFAKGAGIDPAKADKIGHAVSGLFSTLQPIPRAGMPEDIARAAVFLASDAASFVNGQDLASDGGLSVIGRKWSEAGGLLGEIRRTVLAAAQ
jgi:NAD(P)-dependent dehydrogenase (short-subunit alcohol dehydrogenase family)